MIRKVYWSIYDFVSPPSYPEELEEVLSDCESLLDLGCGTDSPVRHFSDSIYCVGVDAFEEAIEESKEQRIHDEYYCTDVLEAIDRVGRKSFDAVLASDLIEHLPKEEGYELIEMMEEIAEKKSIIFTPNGFLPQEPYNGNPFQEHLSGWTVDEMRSRGYKIIGVNGLKYLRGRRSKIKHKPKSFFRFLSSLSQHVVKKYPKYSFSILCYKKV